MASSVDPVQEEAVVMQLSEMLYYEVKQKLHTLSDEDITRMWIHVCAEHFHPDTEFEFFKLEGRMAADEFVDMLMEEFDERSHRSALPQTA